MLESALDRHRLILDNEGAIFALTAGFDERAPASVLEDELVAEYLGHLAFNLYRAQIGHGRNRDRRERRIRYGLPSAPVVRRDGADADADRENGNGCPAGKS
jgi:hypothetical protein